VIDNKKSPRVLRSVILMLLAIVIAQHSALSTGHYVKHFSSQQTLQLLMNTYYSIYPYMAFQTISSESANVSTTANQQQDGPIHTRVSDSSTMVRKWFTDTALATRERETYKFSPTEAEHHDPNSARWQINMKRLDLDVQQHSKKKW
jgi:hypothetical protein